MLFLAVWENLSTVINVSSLNGNFSHKTENKLNETNKNEMNKNQMNKNEINKNEEKRQIANSLPNPI